MRWLVTCFEHNIMLRFFLWFQNTDILHSKNAENRTEKTQILWKIIIIDKKKNITTKMSSFPRSNANSENFELTHTAIVWNTESHCHFRIAYLIATYIRIPWRQSLLPSYEYFHSNFYLSFWRLDVNNFLSIDASCFIWCCAYLIQLRESYDPNNNNG